MRLRWFGWLFIVAWLVAGDAPVAWAQERYVGVRRDSTGEIILFSLDAAQGERKIATLVKEGVSIQLLGITTLNARRGTFSYAFTDVATGKDYLQTSTSSRARRSRGSRCPPMSRASKWCTMWARSWSDGPTRTP